jgi:hypothetical protein
MKIMRKIDTQISKFDKSVQDLVRQHRSEWENKSGLRKLVARIRIEVWAWWKASNVFRDKRGIE